MCSVVDVLPGDRVIAKDYVPDLMDPCSCFDKGEVATVEKIEKNVIYVKTRFGDLEQFLIEHKNESLKFSTWFEKTKGEAQ
jgi:hypothetical protein